MAQKLSKHPVAPDSRGPTDRGIQALAAEVASTFAAPPARGRSKPKAKAKLSDLEYAKKLEAECVYWPTSRLVAHIAWTLHRGIGDVSLPQVDLAVVRELDRRIPPPTSERMARARKGTP